MSQSQLSEQTKTKYIEEEKKRQELNEEKRTILRRILDRDALHRLDRIETVKPQKAELFKNFILQNGMKMTGGAPLNDEQLKSLLQQFESSQPGGQNVTVQIRRKHGFSDSEDE